MAITSNTGWHARIEDRFKDVGSNSAPSSTVVLELFGRSLENLSHIFPKLVDFKVGIFESARDGISGPRLRHNPILLKESTIFSGQRTLGEPRRFSYLAMLAATQYNLEPQPIAPQRARGKPDYSWLTGCRRWN